MGVYNHGKKFVYKAVMFALANILRPENKNHECRDAYLGTSQY